MQLVKFTAQSLLSILDKMPPLTNIPETTFEHLKQHIRQRTQGVLEHLKS